MANQEMERALTFAGYEVNHVWGEGGHSGEHATKIFPDAMRWLWKDWPEAGQGRAGSQQLQEILIPGEDWKLVAEGYKFTEGPAANAKGEVFFNDVGATQDVQDRGRQAGGVPRRTRNAATARRSARTAGCTRSPGAENKILACDAEGKSTVIADGFRGNDLVVRHDGGIYVTNPGETPNNSKVWYISPKGEKKVVDTGLKFANGITLSPDQSLLYVADSRTHWVYSYQIQPDGSLADKQKYYHLHVPDTRRRQRRRRHARRPRRPALRRDADGHPGLRPGRPRELHHPDAERQGLEPAFGGAELRHALRHLRRQGLQAQGEGEGRERL